MKTHFYRCGGSWVCKETNSPYHSFGLGKTPQVAWVQFLRNRHPGWVPEWIKNNRFNAPVVKEEPHGIWVFPI